MNALYAQLQAAFHDETSSAHRATSGVIWAMILASVVLFVVELNLDPETQLFATLRRIDTVLLWFFVLEYVLRLVTFRPPQLALYDKSAVWQLRTHVTGRLVFALSPFMLIDLITIMGLVPALRALRALRFLRLLRGVRLFRYSNPLLGLVRGLQENALLYAFILGGLTLFVVTFGAVFGVAEVGPNDDVHSVADGIWWAMVTITTVGYGDISPETGIGKTIGGILMLGGMFTLAAFAGVVGSTLLTTLLRLRQDQFRMSYYVNHTVVCGYSESTRILLDSLVNERGGMDGEILVFAGGDRPQDLPAEVIWIDGDPTKESELDKVRLPFAATAIITGDRRLPNPQLADAVTILVAFTMRSYLDKQPNYRERATPVYVVAEILDTENIQHARKAGADEVIETRRIGYSMLAHAAFAHGSGAVLSDVASHGTHSVWFGRRPNDLDSPTFGVLVTTIKARTGATVIGVRDADGQVSLGPSDDLKVGADTAVVYLAREPVLEPLDG